MSKHVKDPAPVVYSLDPQISGIARHLNSVWVRFAVVCFLYKTIPNPRKMICCGKKVAQNAAFSLVFLGVGLALDWGVRRFHDNIYAVFQLNRIW